PDSVGLRLGEAQDLLAAVQDTVVEQQVQRAIAEKTACPHCGRDRRHKDTRSILVRSLFGVLRLPSPRWWHCDCQEQPTRSFQPLAALLPERTTPELAYLQARFAGLVSYGITAKVIPAQGRASCFGYVQTYDTKPKRRVFEVLKAQGMAANQQVTFLTDGGEDIPRPSLLPQRPGRAPARLVPHHDADHGHGQ